MRRLAFVLLATLIVGVSTAGPAQGYWSLFHSPHHLRHPQGHHFHHHPQGASGPVQPITVGQVLGAINLGQQLLGPFFHPNPSANQTPAPEPRLSAATSAAITQNGKAVDAAAGNVNKLLELVRKGDPRHDAKTLPDVKAGAAAGNVPGNAAGFNLGGAGGGGPTPSDKKDGM